jgi:hypothetical protein
MVVADHHISYVEIPQGLRTFMTIFTEHLSDECKRCSSIRTGTNLRKRTSPNIARNNKMTWARRNWEGLQQHKVLPGDLYYHLHPDEPPFSPSEEGPPQGDSDERGLGGVGGGGRGTGPGIGWSSRSLGARCLGRIR